MCSKFLLDFMFIKFENDRSHILQSSNSAYFDNSSTTIIPTLVKRGS